MAWREDCGFRTCGSIELQRGQDTGPRFVPHLFFAMVPQTSSSMPTVITMLIMVTVVVIFRFWFRSSSARAIASYPDLAHLRQRDSRAF
jgi:hypothetical protein